MRYDFARTKQNLNALASEYEAYRASQDSDMPYPKILVVDDFPPEMHQHKRIIDDALLESLEHLRISRTTELERDIRERAGVTSLEDFDDELEHPEKYPLRNWQNNYLDLSKILLICNGAVDGMNVLDLGCGSPSEETYLHNFYPFTAEVLQRLGANVVGVDYRYNHSASYEHRVFDFSELGTAEAEQALSGDYDLIIARRLLYEGLRRVMNEYKTIIKLLKLCVKSQQFQFIDNFSETEEEKVSEELGIKFIRDLNYGIIE